MTKRKAHSIESIISIISLIVAFSSFLLTLFWNLRQEHKIDKLDYKNNAVNYQPRLEIYDKPIIKSISIDSLKLFSQEDSLWFLMKVKIDFDIKVINSGNDIAKLYAFAQTDTFSGGDFLRRILLKKQNNVPKIDFSKGDFFFRNQEILPGDTSLINIDHSINCISNLIDGTLHVLILYKNSNNALYDTYYWAKFKADPIQVPYALSSSLNDSSIMMTFDVSEIENELPDSYYFEEFDFSMYIYDYDEKELILKQIEIARNKFEN